MGTHEWTSPTGRDEQLPKENLDPRHFYAAYSFDGAETRQSDVITLIEEAKRLGYPVRYWWLSDAMDLQGSPDRLIVCVHHPSSATDAGMDLYEALKEKGVQWDDLEKAAVEEYLLYSKSIKGPGGISKPDGTLLFPPEVEGEPTTEPEKPPTRDDDPLFTLTRGDIQSVAQGKLGRDLTEAEIKAVMAALWEPLDWVFSLKAAIDACQMFGKVGPAAQGWKRGAKDLDADAGQPVSQSVATQEKAPTSEFLVYYSLSAMMYVRAAGKHEASEDVFASLHDLVGKIGTHGVTATKAKEARLDDAYVVIDVVEPITTPPSEDEADKPKDKT